MRYVEAHLPDEAATWQELVLVPLADLHIGAPEFQEKLFLEVRDWIAGAPNRYTVLNGDLLDMALRNSKGDVYRATMPPSDARRYLQHVLEPIRDRILAITDGNHEERMIRDTDMSPSEWLADMWGIPYDRYGVLVKMVFGPGHKRRPRPVAYQIYATHGSSGARRLGGKVNHMEDAADNWEGIDVHIGSHTHVKAAVKKRKLVADPYNKRVILREVLIVNTSTFLDWGSYAERRAYAPSALGPPHIVLSGVRKQAQAIV